MSTLTFKQTLPPGLPRTYENIEEFLLFVYRLRNEDLNLDFHELEASDVTPLMKHKVQSSLEKPLSHFSSLSSR